MEIICSGCKARYSLKRDELDTFEYGVFTCGNCGRKVKVVICPHCDASYSVTYDSVLARKYVASCKKCRSRFIVTFPPDPVADSGLDKKTEANDRLTIASDKSSVTSEEISDERSKDRVKEETRYGVAGNESPETERRVSVNGGGGRDSSFTGLISAVMSSFSPLKIATAFLGVTVTVVFYALIRYISPLITTLEISSMGFSPLAALMAMFMYTVTAAAIARITIEKIRYGRGLSFQSALADSFRGTFSFLIAALVIIVIFYGGLHLFGLIPALTPVFFALLFLPLYLFFLAGFLFGIVGIWFYPPVVVDPEAGGGGGFFRLFCFAKRHGSVLVCAVPLLTVACIFAGSLLSLIHYGATMFAAEVTRAMGGESAVSIFSSVPDGLRAIIDLSYPGRTVKYFGDFLFQEGAMHRMGGLVVGLPLLAVSLLFLASLISIAVTLSTHAYVIIESGTEKKDAKWIRMALTAVFVMLAVYLLKRFIP